MSAIRVLYTINNLSTAGSRLVVANLVRDLDRTRFAPIIAVGRRTGSELELELEGLCPILETTLKVARRPRSAFVSRLRAAAHRLRGVADLAQSFDYSSDWTEGLAMRMAGIPWIAVKTNLNWNERRWWLRSFLASRLVCLSESQRSLMARWAEKIDLIPIGVDLDAFATAAPVPRSELGADESDVLVVSVAHLVPVKGHVELIRAFASVADELPRLRLLLAGGEGDESAGYAARVRSLPAELGLGDRVRFLGARSDVAPILKACDAMILATRDEGRREAFGTVLVEAMAAGRPVVATRSGGPEDIVVDGETGWLVDTRGWEPLARALRELYADAERRARYGRAGRERARRLYGKETMACRHEAVYEAVLGHASPRGSRRLAYGVGGGAGRS